MTSSRRLSMHAGMVFKIKILGAFFQHRVQAHELQVSSHRVLWRKEHGMQGHQRLLQRTTHVQAPESSTRVALTAFFLGALPQFHTKITRQVSRCCKGFMNDAAAAVDVKAVDFFAAYSPSKLSLIHI